ncbi:MAG: hypothetical protein KAH25_04545 [Bacteroidales bacterium]|nr:hypothetical protein [Bacteroidales bacterium]
MLTKVIKSILVLLIFSSVNLLAQKISPDNKHIYIHGAKFVKMVDGELVMHRHSDEIYSKNKKVIRFNPEKAQSNTGISIVFKTSSPTIKVNMKISDKEFKKKPRSGSIGIYQNKETLKLTKHTFPVEPINPNSAYQLAYNKGKEFTIDIKSENVGDVVEYKLILPLFIDVHLLSIELEDGHKLKRIKDAKKPVYVAYGNSITHGTGQKYTNETYAYLISEWNNWELYNLAVGGGKTSPAMAKMISEEFKKIDYMTVLIGYNDYAGAGESPETYSKNYTTFLNTIRENHPNTKIFCITFTETKMSKSKKSDHVPEEFRNVARKIVGDRQSNGDKSIYLIEGKDISKKEWLRDNVHYTVDGILKVADKLYYEIEKNK